MVTSDLGACEWFVWDLRRSNLIDRGQLDQIVGEFLGKHPGAEPPALAEYLISQGILTHFQADRLLQGKTQGFVLGPFTLMDALGSGSMGTVYKALSKTDNEWYAVKVLPRRSMWNVRIARRKVRAFETCQHPAVVPFVDVGTSGSMHYLAWPLVEGETLERLVQREGKLNPERAARYVAQVAEGLDLCHAHGLFHGLIKPSNLSLGKDDQVRILDFGIGSLLAETEGESLVDTMSTANSVSSGLDCASPESIMDPSNLSALGDQYSLGCVLYFFLSGQYPFPDGTAVEKMMAHQHKQPTPVRELNPAIPAGLAEVVERLMQKVPEARYSNCAEVVEALRAFSGHFKPAARPTSRATPTRDMKPNGTPLPASLPSGGRKSWPAAQTPPPIAQPVVAPLAPTPTPPPSPRTRPSGPLLPTRQSLSIQSRPAQTGGYTAGSNGALAAVPEYAGEDEPKKRGWEDKLGPMGIAICAVLACVLVWLLTYRLF